MSLSDSMTRYCRAVLYPQRDRDDCGRRVSHHRAGVTHDERTRQLATLRVDRSAIGQCWNPR